MPRRLLFFTGYSCLQVALAAATTVQCSEDPVEEDVCSTMQTRKGEPERHPRVETTVIKAEALDRLVERQNHATAFGVKEGRNGVLRHVQIVEAWIDSRPPEVRTVIKAVVFSWIIAMMVGLVGLSLGIVKWHPPSKYISFKALSASGAGGGLCAVPSAILLGILNIPSNMMYLSLETRRAMCGIILLFGVIFLIMWNAGLVQPFLNQLASYLYVYALVGSVCIVIVVDLMARAQAHINGPLQALRRMQHQFTRLEERLGLVSTAPPQEDEAASPK